MPRLGRLLPALLSVLLAACAVGPGPTSPPVRSPSAGTPVPVPLATPSPTPVPTPSPSPTPVPAYPAWTTGETPLLATPGPEARSITVLTAGMPVIVTGGQAPGADPVAVKVRTHVPLEGWIARAALAGAAPAAPGIAPVTALDPELAADLAAYGKKVGLAVRDLAAGIQYEYNADTAFITGSSVKVAIMLALLRQLEAKGLEPDDETVDLLEDMITRSDNDAATTLNARVGDRAGLTEFAEELGLVGFKPGSHYDQGWGWGTLTPAAMVQLLSLFQAGDVLSDPEGTALARDLMRRVIASQRFGVGDTAPKGATVLMKNGWVPGPDGRWVVNSSGIVTTRSGHTYVIAVYTAHNASYGAGLAMVERAAGAVADALGT